MALQQIMKINTKIIDQVLAPELANSKAGPATLKRAAVLFLSGLSLWSYGHRNQQGSAFHATTGDLWTSEHGPRGGDELNLTVKGKNYGWPTITFGINEDGTPITDKTAAEGMEQPAAYWTPAIAPSGIAFYTGERFPQWKHSLFIACLGGQQLRRIEMSGPKVTDQETIFSGFGRVRDVTMGPDGYLYVATNAPGQILRLVPAS